MLRGSRINSQATIHKKTNFYLRTRFNWAVRSYLQWLISIKVRDPRGSPARSPQSLIKKAEIVPHPSEGASTMIVIQKLFRHNVIKEFSCFPLGSYQGATFCSDSRKVIEDAITLRLCLLPYEPIHARATLEGATE